MEVLLLTQTVVCFKFVSVLERKRERPRFTNLLHVINLQDDVEISQIQNLLVHFASSEITLQ